jgi:hypothetical protein
MCTYMLAIANVYVPPSPSYKDKIVRGLIHAQEAALEKELADKMEAKRGELVRVADEEYEKKRYPTPAPTTSHAHI